MVGATLAAVLAILASLNPLAALPSAAQGASQFSGTVVDSTGNPVAGAYVGLTEQGDTANNYQVQTGADGSFSEIVNSGTYSAYVLETGVADQLVEGTVDLSGSITGATVTMPAVSIPVTVSVTDTLGDPIAGASVAIAQPNGVVATCTDTAWDASPVFSDSEFLEEQGNSSATTDSTGTASFGLAPCPGLSFKMEALAGGYASSLSATSTPTGPTTIPIVLTPNTVTFSGIVQTPAGTPLADTKVSLSYPGSVSTYTNANGAFSLPPVPSGTYQLTVAGYTADNAEYQLNANVVLNGSQVGTTVTVPINPLTVSVSDTSGNPVPGATVSVEGSCQSFTAFDLFPGATVEEGNGSYLGDSDSAVTDSTGTATLETLPCNSGFQIGVTPASGSSLESVTLSAPPFPDGSASDQVVLGEANQFSGTVVDSTGNPVAGAYVGLTEQGDTANNYQVQTGADGSFSEIVNSGTYSAYVLETGVADQLVEGTVDLSGSITGATVTMPAVSIPVTVSVTDTLGDPIAGASVAIAQPNGVVATCTDTAWDASPVFSDSEFLEEQGNSSATTDSTGTASFGLAPCPGLSFKMEALAGGYASSLSATSTPTGPTTIPIVLTPNTVTFSGIVQTPAGTPLADTKVSLSYPGSVSTYTNANGAFSLPPVPSGTYQLTVAGYTADNAEYQLNANVVLNGSQVGTTVTVPINPLTVSVSDTSGNPVPGATVSVEGSCQSFTAFDLFPGATVEEGNGSYLGDSDSAVTDSTGTATLETLPCNSGFQIGVTPASGSSLESVTLSAPPFPDGSASDQVVLGEANQFSGTVVDSTGNPVAGAYVGLTEQGDTANNYQVQTGADGSFSEIVNSGTYSAYVLETGVADQLVEGTVDLSGSITGATVTMPAVSIPVTVSVTDTLGDPIAGASVAIAQPNGVVATCTDTAWDASPVFSDSEFLEEQGNSSATTDSTGTASFGLAPCPGLSFKMEALAGGYASSLSATSTPTGPTTIPIVLTPNTVTFSGIVQTPAGTPLADTKVSLSYPGSVSTYTNANGAFSLPPVPSGTYQLTVAGYTADNAEYQLNANVVLNGSQVGTTVTVPINPLTVSVSDTSGNPVPGATVSVEGSCQSFTAFDLFPGATVEEGNGSYLGDSDSAVTDSTGTATLETLPCNSGFQIGVTPASGTVASYANETLNAPSFPDGPATDQVTLGSLDGTVVDGNDEPLVGQQVDLLNSTGSTVAQATTNSTGDFALSPPAGTYSMVLSGSVGDPTTYRVTDSKLTFKHPEQVEIAIPTAVVRLQVDGRKSKPVNGATLTAPCTQVRLTVLGRTAKGKECINETSDPAGSASLELFKGSTVDVTVSPLVGSNLRASSLEVSANAESPVVVRLK